MAELRMIGIKINPTVYQAAVGLKLAGSPHYQLTAGLGTNLIKSNLGGCVIILQGRIGVRLIRSMEATIAQGRETVKP